MFYARLEAKDYYLPAEGTKGCSSEYLRAVQERTVFIIPNKYAIHGICRNSQFDAKHLVRIYNRLVSNLKITSGFDVKHLPHKQYIINCIKSIDPLNEIFNSNVPPSDPMFSTSSCFTKK